MEPARCIPWTAASRHPPSHPLGGGVQLTRSNGGTSSIVLLVQQCFSYRLRADLMPRQPFCADLFQAFTWALPNTEVPPHSRPDVHKSPTSAGSVRTPTLGCLRCWTDATGPAASGPPRAAGRSAPSARRRAPDRPLRGSAGVSPPHPARGAPWRPRPNQGARRPARRGARGARATRVPGPRPTRGPGGRACPARPASRPGRWPRPPGRRPPICMRCSFHVAVS